MKNKTLHSQLKNVLTTSSEYGPAFEHAKRLKRRDPYSASLMVYATTKSNWDSEYGVAPYDQSNRAALLNGNGRVMHVF